MAREDQSLIEELRAEAARPSYEVYERDNLCAALAAAEEGRFDYARSILAARSGHFAAAEKMADRVMRKTGVGSNGLPRFPR